MPSCEVGEVLRVYTVLARPPKHKIVLYVGAHLGIDLFLWFNTEARKRPAQLPVARGEVPGISRDCFLDCGQVTTFSSHELEQAEHLGSASDAFLLRIAEEVEMRASTLARGHRNAVAQTLRRRRAEL